MQSAVLLGALLIGGFWVDGAAAQQAPAGVPAPKPATQAPPQPAPKPATQTPPPSKPTPTPPPAARRPAAATARAGMAITVTDSRGSALSDIDVQVIGITDRAGNTNALGQINFTGLQAGTYRVRFSGEPVTTFEREVVVRPGQVADVNVTLNPAPPPPPPPDPPPAPSPVAPPTPTVGQPGKPLTLSLLNLIEKEFVGKQPRRETLLSCSGNTRTTLVQLNQDQAERLYDTADVTYYVVGGEGSLRVEGRDTQFPTAAFISVPRGTAHAIERRGRRPLILLATLSGTPCEETR